MRWRFWRRDNGQAAMRARAEAERRLKQARKDWPEVRQTHDALAEMIENALRGRA